MPRPPQTWTRRELERDAARAKTLFVKERLAALQREQQTYEGLIAKHSSAVENLLTATSDLRQLKGSALKSRNALDVLRYAVSPIVSLDDLDTLTDSSFKAWVGQTTERGVRPTDGAFNAAAAFFAPRIDRTRAPWLVSGGKATPAERAAFTRATASIRAMGAVATARRMERSKQQEDAIRAAAVAAYYAPATSLPGTLTDPIKQMQPGTFAPKSRKLAATNMDVPIRLTSTHATGLFFLAVEAKVSNSSLNSRKRLLEVTRKRERWDASGALYQFRTAAVLAGVFSVERLVEAQEAGVLLFWEHQLRDLTAFLK